MMKRASLDFHQSRAVHEQDRARLKHQTLMQEYLDLQKEFVSKKRKLQAAKQNRDTLLAEIRFLRRRRRYIVKIQSPKLQLENELVHLQNSDIETKIHERERNYSSYEAALGNLYPVLVSNPNLGGEEEKGEEQGIRGLLRVEKKPNSYFIDDNKVGKKRKSYLVNDKRVGKKKISWQDSVTLKV